MSENLLQRISNIKKNNQSVLVVGLGISGLATADILSDAGITVVAVDKGSESDFNSRLNTNFSQQTAHSLNQKGVKLHFQVDGEGVTPYLKDIGLCVLSPGVSLESSIVGAIERAKIAIVNELELAIDLIGVPTITVTGSNGKSTTVSLIASMLNNSGINAKLCGNVGIPVISLLKGRDILSTTHTDIADCLVVEASSYQIETSHHLKPKVGVWLNISENHLERHGTIDRYLSIKGRIFINQTTSDSALVNIDDDRADQLLSMIKGSVIFFGRNLKRLKDTNKPFAHINYEPSSHIDEIQIYLNKKHENYKLDHYKLLGLHNRYNCAAAIMASRLMGATEAGCRDTLKSFTSLRHRYQDLGTFCGVRVINDSKSTTVASTCAALNSTLESFPQTTVHLLIGGMVKAGSWNPLINLLKGRISEKAAVVCFGGDGKIIKNHLETAQIPTILTRNVKDAFLSAMTRATSGDIVLFSPGCASFDEFQNFEKRGEALENYFKEYEQHNSTQSLVAEPDTFTV